MVFCRPKVTAPQSPLSPTKAWRPNSAGIRQYAHLGRENCAQAAAQVFLAAKAGARRNGGRVRWHPVEAKAGRADIADGFDAGVHQAVQRDAALGLNGAAGAGKRQTGQRKKRCNFHVGNSLALFWR
jgi:hypothetical protein